MKTTILLMSLGFLGYTLYNKYFNSRNLVGATGGIGNAGTQSSGRQYQPGSVHLNKTIESQAEKGEGLTDESKTGIED